jgi:2,3-bisphosphoglycerate-independent phosphoglycerate mutase
VLINCSGSPCRRVIFLFLDGVGLGLDDPAINPLAVRDYERTYPTLAQLLGGARPVLPTGRLDGPGAHLLPADAQMGVGGRPQSATGQAALLTGLNAPQLLGEHYGPRPDRRVRAILDRAGIFRRLAAGGRRPFFCNAYPQRYFEVIHSGRRRLSAVPHAVVSGGQRLLTHVDLLAGRGLSADFTNQGWRDELGYSTAPVYAAAEAGSVLWQMAQPYDFVFFEHWMTDVYGHEQALGPAITMLQRFDGFLGGLVAAADLSNTLIIVASDHGNVEDCSHGKHTTNPAFGLMVGQAGTSYVQHIRNLTDFPAVALDYLGISADFQR